MNWLIFSQEKDSWISQYERPPVISCIFWLKARYNYDAGGEVRKVL